MTKCHIELSVSMFDILGATIKGMSPRNHMNVIMDSVS